MLLQRCLRGREHHLLLDTDDTLKWHFRRNTSKAVRREIAWKQVRWGNTAEWDRAAARPKWLWCHFITNGRRKCSMTGGGKLSVQLDFQLYRQKGKMWKNKKNLSGQIPREGQIKQALAQTRWVQPVTWSLEFLMFVPWSGSHFSASVQSPGLCEEGRCPLWCRNMVISDVPVMLSKYKAGSGRWLWESGTFIFLTKMLSSNYLVELKVESKSLIIIIFWYWWNSCAFYQWVITCKGCDKKTEHFSCSPRGKILLLVSIKVNGLIQSDWRKCKRSWEPDRLN